MHSRVYIHYMNNYSLWLVNPTSPCMWSLLVNKICQVDSLNHFSLSGVMNKAPCIPGNYPFSPMLKNMTSYKA